MQLDIGKDRVHISWESLLWFLAFTAAGTVVGMIAYDYLLKYFPNFSGVSSNLPPEIDSSVVATQPARSSVGRITRLPYARQKVSA